MCQPRVDRSVGSPSLEDSDIRIEKKWNWKEKRQEEPDFSQSGFQFALCEWLVSTKGSGAAKRKSYKRKMEVRLKWVIPFQPVDEMCIRDRDKTIVDMYINGHSFDDIWAASGFSSKSSICLLYTSRCV